MAFTHPFRKVMCPFCFERFHPSGCRVLSEQLTEEGEHVVLKDRSRGLLGGFWLSPLSGAKYLENQAARECPACGEMLPHNIEYMQGSIIGLVGGTYSGKSHYIASLIHELRRGDMFEKIGCTRFAPVNGDVDQRYRANYYEPVYVRKEALPPNVPLRPGDVNRPLIYEMIFEGRSRMDPRKLVNLSLFDASGEQIEKEEELAVFSRYILNASAIIVLVDPITMPDVRERLPYHMRPDAVPGYDAFDIINTVTRTYERYRGYRPGTPIDVPVVIALAKSDLLRYALEGLGVQASFLRDAPREEGFDLDDFEAVSEEVQEIISRFAGPGLIHTTRNTFPKLAFSAISATGGPPNSEGQFPSIAPRRVLDPLLWSLWRLNMISASRRAQVPDPVPQPARP